MTKQQIIFDWLSVKANRDSIPVMTVSKEVFYFIQIVGAVYSFDFGKEVSDGERVYEFNNMIYKLKIST